MGACDFQCIGRGRTAQEAFREAREQALYDYGHAGYTGTIAEKHSFVMIEDTWKTIKGRLDTMVKGLNKMVQDLGPGTKYDPAAFERRLNGLPVQTFYYALPKNKTEAVKQLRLFAKRYRAERDKCTAKMRAGDIADKLIDLGDPRVDDKWGPAGCIDMDPRLTGKRKAKRFLFFGLASS